MNIHGEKGYRTINCQYTAIEDLLENKFNRFEGFKELARELVEGNSVVEIGASSTPQTCLWQFNPGKYTCVEAAFRRKVNDVPDFVEHRTETDGVSYLETLDDNSVVVVSSGLFDTSILSEDYARELVRLIGQKTKSNGLSLHTFSGGGYERFFLDNGMNLEYGKRVIGDMVTECDVRNGVALGTIYRRKDDIIPLFFRKGERE